MSRLFDPENKFWNFIGKIADVTCMSFLWVGTSLPLVTMGAATTAFYSYTMHQVRDTEGGILSGYFKAFRHNFKKATLLWLLEVAGLAFFTADLVGVWNLFLFLGGLPAILVGALVLCLAFLFLGCTFYIWPLLAVLVGVTNIVPVLGPFLGAVPGLIILLLELPWKAAEFAIIIFVVQQVDGNFIAPRILGGATGLPGLGVLLAIVVGGAWFGIPGMVLGVPTLAVLAALLKQAVGAGLTARGLDENGEPRRNLPGGPQEN